MTDLNAAEIRFISIVCLAEVLFLIDLAQIINKDARFAISLIAIYISIAKAWETQRFSKLIIIFTY